MSKRVAVWALLLLTSSVFVLDCYLYAVVLFGGNR
jgi:hypothetical protein